MSNVPAHIKAPAVAQVFLLPPEVEQRRTKSRQRRGAILGLAVFMFLLAGAYAYFAFDAKQAEADAILVEEETTRLNGQLAELSFVDRVKERLANAHATRLHAASQEVFWPLLMSSLMSAAPEDDFVREVLVTDANFLGTPAWDGRVLPVQGIFGLEVTADVASFGDIGEFERRLTLVPFLEDVVVYSAANEATAVEDETGEALSTSARYTVVYRIRVNYDALMLRYTDLWFGTSDEDGENSPVRDSLEAYYRAYLDRLLAGDSVLYEYPPLPPAGPPAAGDGSGSEGSGGDASPSPAPSEETVQ